MKYCRKRIVLPQPPWLLITHFVRQSNFSAHPHTQHHISWNLEKWKKRQAHVHVRQSINLYCLCLYPLMLDMFQRKGYKIENVSLRWLGDWYFQFCMMMVMVGMARWCYITIQSVQVNGGGQEYWPIMDQPTITDQHTITAICSESRFCE